MYANQVKANERLKKENKKLRARVAELETENKELHDRVEKLELIVEELHSMIFKKKKKPKAESKGKGQEQKSEKKKRDTSSYRRATPNEDQATETILFEVESCDYCWWKLEKLQEVIRYVEDLYLPKDGNAPLKRVSKEIIQKGCCVDCKKWSFWKEITSQHCTLWKSLKAFVVYASTALMMSYEQIQWFLETMANMSISDWEIAYILKKESMRLKSEYEEMKVRLRKSRVAHFDETGWPVQSLWGKQYAWVMSDTEWIERVYILWASRWWGNLETLKWDSKLIWVSDDYGVYKNWFELHQLCRAHPIRKLRDLAESKKLSKLKTEVCKIAYGGLRGLHKKILEITSHFESITPEQIIGCMKEFDELNIWIAEEPEKLSNIRKSLIKNKEKYFTCMYNEWVPTTNNTAERVLRPLVIKRRLSFGSKTSDWATVMEVLYSVTFSLLAKSKSNFFDAYLAL